MFWRHRARTHLRAPGARSWSGENRRATVRRSRHRSRQAACKAKPMHADLRLLATFFSLMTPPGRSQRIAPSDRGVDACARLWRASKRLPIDRKQAELRLVAEDPFEVVEQRPVHVTAHRHAVVDRA